MTNTTRQTLLKIQQILHEAGWDQSANRLERELNEDRLEPMRHAYEALLRNNHLDILRKTLGERKALPEAARVLGLSVEDAKKLFYEALQRLNEFVEVSEQQGLVSSSKV